MADYRGKVNGKAGASCLGRRGLGVSIGLVVRRGATGDVEAPRW